MLDLINESQYELVLYDDFLVNELQLHYWLPVYLPQWSSRKKTAPSYYIENSILTLFIKDDQEPWCPEWNVKASSAVIGYGLHPFGDYEIEDEDIQIKATVSFGVKEDLLGGHGWDIEVE